MNSKTILIAAVAIVLICGIGAYFLMDDSETSESEEEKVIEGLQLTVFGNANGDSRVDNSDVTELENLIKESRTGIVVKDIKENSHYLADANGDGAVDQNDVQIVKDIAAGKAKDIFILDAAGNYSKVPVNPERVVVEYFSNAEIMQMVGAEKSIVAIDASIMMLSDYYLQGVDTSKVFNMGGAGKPDYEKVEELKPQVWLTWMNTVDSKQTKTTAVPVCLNLTHLDLKNVYNSGVVKGALLAGYIFNNVEAAENYVNWVIDIWTTLHDVSSKLEEKDKPVVFYTSYGKYITNNDLNVLRGFIEGSTLYEAVKLAGGSNFIDQFDLKAHGFATADLDLEGVLTKDFDYLFVHSIKFTGGGTNAKDVPMHGYTTDDSTDWDKAHQDIQQMLPFKKVPLDKVHLSAGDFMNNASAGLLNAVMVATAIHPDLFPDLDMIEVHQQYIDLMGYDFDVSKHGVFYSPFD